MHQTLMIHNAGFNIRQVYEENYTMKFLDGSAFLNHSFIKTAFKNIWFKLLLPTQCAEEIFAEVEHRLNEISISSNLQMEVPFVVFDCFKS